VSKLPSTAYKALPEKSKMEHLTEPTKEVVIKEKDKQTKEAKPEMTHEQTQQIPSGKKPQEKIPKPPSKKCDMSLFRNLAPQFKLTKQMLLFSMTRKKPYFNMLIEKRNLKCLRTKRMTNGL